MRRSLGPKMRAVLTAIAIGSIGYLAFGAVIVNYDSEERVTSSVMMLILVAIMALTTSNPRSLFHKK